MLMKYLQMGIFFVPHLRDTHLITRSCLRSQFLNFQMTMTITTNNIKISTITNEHFPKEAFMRHKSFTSKRIKKKNSLKYGFTTSIMTQTLSHHEAN